MKPSQPVMNLKLSIEVIKDNKIKSTKYHKEQFPDL
jgi:hypothetical protein